MKWAYGITTVETRMTDLLQQTLQSLKMAGFDDPHLFVDGPVLAGVPTVHNKVTQRCPNVRTAGNWFLSAWELYIREPDADRYAIFQDDMIATGNLRAYLERCHYPEKSYLNLYTWPQENKPEIKGWHPSSQMGKGAVALVFDNDALRDLLTSNYMWMRFKDVKGHKSVDGGIVSAMKGMSYREMIHSPTLVLHTGTHSSMGNRSHPQAVGFKGEDFNALDFLE